MPFIIDDLIYRMLGISIPPFDMIWLLEQIQDLTIQEMYDLEKINNSIKENRLLFEIGEIKEEEYKLRHAELMEKLKYANRVRETNFKNRINIFEVDG